METSGVRGIGWDDLDTKDSWQVYLVDYRFSNMNDMSYQVVDFLEQPPI